MKCFVGNCRGVARTFGVLPLVSAWTGEQHVSTWLASGWTGGKAEGEEGRGVEGVEGARKTGWQVTGKCILLFASGHFVLPLYTHTHTPSLSSCLSMSFSLCIALSIPLLSLPIYLSLSSSSALNLSSNWWYCTFLELNQLCRSPTSNELSSGHVFSSPGRSEQKWQPALASVAPSRCERNKVQFL